MTVRQMNLAERHEVDHGSQNQTQPRKRTNNQRLLRVNFFLERQRGDHGDQD